MTDHLIEGVEILLWPHRLGLSAFAAPFVFDLEYNGEGLATIDACRTRLVDFPDGVDRYRALDGPGRARILKAALLRRDDYKDLSGTFDHYLVRSREPDLDEATFLRIVAGCILAWRRRSSD